MSLDRIYLLDPHLLLYVFISDAGFLNTPSYIDMSIIFLLETKTPS